MSSKKLPTLKYTSARIISAGKLWPSASALYKKKKKKKNNTRVKPIYKPHRQKTQYETIVHVLEKAWRENCFPLLVVCTEKAKHKEKLFSPLLSCAFVSYPIHRHMRSYLALGCVEKRYLYSPSSLIGGLFLTWYTDTTSTAPMLPWAFFSSWRQ